MNQLLFLGTGAADWDSKSRGDFFRRHSAARLNGDLLLDFGDHVWDYVQRMDANALNNVTEVLITHDHSDHFSPEAIRKLADKQPIRVACDGFARVEIGKHDNILFVPVLPFKAFSMGRYEVMPVLANHDVVQKGIRQACHYIIRTPDNKKVFYGLDGAWFLRPSWEEMLRHKFQVMVLDCTVGDQDDWRMFEHNTVPMLRKMVPEIRTRKMVDADGMIVGSHFARTLHGSHAETEKTLRGLSMLTAFDGLKLEF